MKWRLLAAYAAMVVSGAGCSWLGPRWALPDSSPPSKTDSPAPSVTRSQQPEAEAGRPTPNAPPAEEPPAPPSGQGFITCRIRAIVNGKPILDDELREACYAYLLMVKEHPEPQRSQEQKEILMRELDKLIEREIIMSDLEEKFKARPQLESKLKEFADKEWDKYLKSIRERTGVKSDDDLKQVLASQGLTLPNLRRNIERTFMSNEYMRSRIFEKIDKVGHADIKQYYDEHPGEFQVEDRVKWQDIFVDAFEFQDRGAAHELAEKIAAAARAGEDFLALGKKFDQGESFKYRNGEGFGQKHGEIKPVETEPVLFNMRPGDIGPVLELSTGFHIVRLVQRDYAGKQPLDEKTQSEIKKKLQNIIAEKEYRRIVEELKQKATIVKMLED